MAKRKQKEAIAPIKSSLSPKPGKKLTIDSIPLSDIWEFKDIMEDAGEQDAFKQIVLNVVSVMTIVVLLVQIRLSLPDLKNEVVDRCPSFKFYKNRFITSESGKILAVSLGLRFTYGFEKSESVEFLVGSYVDSLTSAHRTLDKVTENNYGEYLKGRASRIIGLLQSCPATNLKALSLSAEDVSELSIQDVIDRCGIKAIADFELTPDEVIKFIRNNSLVTQGGLPLTTLVFSEPASSSKIESEIFGKDEIQRTGESSPSSTRSQTSSDISDEEMKELLTPVQYQRFITARNSNSSNLVKDYYSIAKKNKEKSTS